MERGIYVDVWVGGWVGYMNGWMGKQGGWSGRSQMDELSTDVVAAGGCRVPEHDGGELFVAMLRAFNGHFFQCEVCHKHFTQVLARPEVQGVKTRINALMWLWSTHNEVRG